MPHQLQRVRQILSNRYKIERVLDSGGSATVYLAFDLKHQREVALKVFHPDLAATVGPDRFLREITLTARLSHPNIVPLLDSGQAGGLLFYVMPYIRGESLRERLEREIQLPEDVARDITMQVADALTYAHSEGIVHRDVKPENILLSDGRAFVADFGIAKAVTEAGDDRLTESGLAVGTAAYMSPEQSQGTSQIDGGTDTYALGCVVYEMLTGEPPYTGPTAQSIVAKRISDPVPSVRRVRETVPRHVDGAITKALAKVSADRFDSPNEFASALASGVEQKGTGVSWRSVGWLAAIVGVTALIFWSVLPGAGPSDTQTEPTRVAVFPFVVEASSDLEYLGGGAMELLSSALDGIGQIRRVDPFALSRYLEKRGFATVGPEEAQEVARHFGAGRFVLGRVLEIGDGLRLSASVYGIDATDPLSSETIEGYVDELSSVTEALAARVIAHLPAGRGVRLEDLRTVRAANYDALRAYLIGEDYWRRGWPDSALPHLREAVGLDSTFALAWYRLGVAEGFSDWTGGVYPTEQAMRYRDVLPWRDQMLVEARYALWHGDGRRGERVATELTKQFPDHVEAWEVLATIRNFYSWQYGQPILSTLDPVVRALALEPDHPEVAWRAVFTSMIRGDYDVAAGYLDAIVQGGGASFWLPILPDILAYQHGDGEGRQRLLAILEDANGFTVFNAGFLTAGATDSLPVAQEIYQHLTAEHRPSHTRAFGHLQLAHVEVARGRWTAASVQFDSAGRLAPDLSLVYRAWLAALPFLDLQPSELAGIRASVQQWEPPIQLATPGLLRFLDLPTEVSPQHAKVYLLGLLSARLGEYDAAARSAMYLETMANPPDSVDLRADLAAELRALAAWQDGRFSEAVLLLDGLSLRLSEWADLFTPMNHRPFARYVLAESLAEVGRTDEVIGWHGSWQVAWGTEFIWRAPAEWRLGRILEAEEPTRAATHYESFIARWKDSDPALQPRVEDARRRLARLQP